MLAHAIPSRSEVEQAFIEAMHAAGFMVGSIVTDTEHFERFDAPGDTKGKRNGFYKLKTGQFPVGWFGDWKTGEQHQWFYQKEGQTLSDAERRKIKDEQRRLKMEAQQARELKQAEVAEDAQRVWGGADTNVEGHPYLERKLIAIPRGLRMHTAKDGTRLLAVPMWSFDMNGRPALTSIQFIDENGSKRFMKAGRVEGTFFSLKGDTQIIVFCEGVATAFSIWQATGLSVVACFNAKNLVDVLKDFKVWRPMSTFLLCADDDVMAPDDWAVKGQGRAWVNVGRTKAEAAAKAVGCRWTLPVFKDGPARSRTDYNDLHAQEGLERVSEQVLGAFRSVEAEDAAAGAKIVDISSVQDESWRSQIPLLSSGALDGGNVQGVTLFIQNHKLLRGRMAFNQFTRAMELDGNEMEDYHVAEFRRIMHEQRFKARKSDVQDEMDAEARRNSYDPLLQYLNGLKWDNKERLSTWLTEYIGADDTPYVREVGRKFLIGAVARAMKPGCKMDSMLVLEGPQGVGKSTAIRYLFGERFFTDNLPDFHSKDAFQQLQGAWCIEVAELSAMTKADVKDVKQFLSRVEDKFRPPYGRAPIISPRRTVFAGSVNPEMGGGYLRDPTGARRFWPVACGKVNLTSLLRDRDQIWAEACLCYAAGEKWFIEDMNIEQLATAEQDARRELHPWEEPIREFLLSKDTCTIHEILSDCLKVPVDKQNPATSRTVGAALRALGWESKVERVNGVSKTVRVYRRNEQERLDFEQDQTKSFDEFMNAD